MTEISRLLDGFQSFRETYFAETPQLFQTLNREGQKPKVLVIACSDSRVDPAILFNAAPGELFVVRNVANLVPPYQPDGQYHGTSAAIEFAVRDLQVAEILVLGHSSCGGIGALRDLARGHPENREFIGPWVAIAADACSAHAGAAEVEQAAIRQSVGNLRSFPWLAEREASGALTLHGWWFDLDAGALWRLAGDRFVRVEVARPEISR
jgi:carbonic anhydrase